MSYRQLLKTSCTLIVLVTSPQIPRHIGVHLVILRHTHVQETGHSGRDGMQSTAILFLHVGEQQPRRETTEQPIPVYCKKQQCMQATAYVWVHLWNYLNVHQHYITVVMYASKVLLWGMCEYTAALSLLPEEMKINTTNYWFSKNANSFMLNYALTERASVKKQQTDLGRTSHFC